MTSPFNPLNAPTGLTPGPSGSSPFPLPNFPSPFPQFNSQPPGQSPLAFSGPTGFVNPSQAGPSTLHNAPSGVSPFPFFPQGEGSSPFPFLPTGNTPGATAANTPNVSRLQNLAWTNQPRKPPAASSVGERSTKAGVEDMIRGLSEAEKLVDRAIVVQREIQRLEEATFVNDGKDRSEGMEPGATGMPKLEELCFEYTQLLSTLLNLSNTTLFGALPVPLSAATPDSTAASADRSMDDSKRNPTLAELTAWAEARAALEFNRREAVKSAGKAVVDVLKGSAAK